MRSDSGIPTTQVVCHLSGAAAAAAAADAECRARDRRCVRTPQAVSHPTNERRTAVTSSHFSDSLAD